MMSALLNTVGNQILLPQGEGIRAWGLEKAPIPTAECALRRGDTGLPPKIGMAEIRSR